MGGAGRGAEEISVPSSDATPAAEVVMETMLCIRCYICTFTD